MPISAHMPYFLVCSLGLSIFKSSVCSLVCKETNGFWVTSSSRTCYYFNNEWETELSSPICKWFIKNNYVKTKQRREEIAVTGSVRQHFRYTGHRSMLWLLAYVSLFQLARSEQTSSLLRSVKNACRTVFGVQELEKTSVSLQIL